jgi:cyclase
MLKKRIIPKFLIRDGRLVKGIEFFGGWREAGNPVSTAKVYDSYGVDEMIFLDIDATPQSRSVNGDIIKRVSEEVFMPFTVGGGIKTLGQIEDLLQAGADKVAINSAAVEDPSFVTQAASRFGNQCIVVAIDYKAGPDGQFVHGQCGTKRTNIDPVEWALRMEDAHAGEIMMTSIDRDGTMDGYDLDMIAALADRLDKPLIASSGAGTLKHCMDALDAGASAITISSMFLFTDQSPIKVRSYLASNGRNVRNQSGSRS